MHCTLHAFTLSLLIGFGATRDVPANVKALRDSIIQQGQCENPLVTGFYSRDSGGPSKFY